VAKEKAEESDRLKTSFLATMSHELRTPLNAIIGFSGLVDESYSKEEILEYIDIINQSGNQLLGIINDLFNLSLLEAGNVSISKSSFKPGSLMQDASELVYGEIKASSKTNVQLIFNQNVASDNLDITTDYQIVLQVLMILLKNAVKFTAKGYVEFGTRLTHDEFVFYVQDTGIGIEENNLDLIFEKFRQVDESSTREFGGVGIGLTIAKGLISMLKGRIWVESTLGKGSCFSFAFKQTDINLKPVFDQALTKSGGLQGKKILVVEDEESNYLLLLNSLKLIGVEIERAYNGMDAVAFVKKNPYIDLILMDLKMPIMDGFTASTAIKKLFPRIPIIAQTAYAMVGDREKALDAGCDDYIAKPIRREALLELLKKHILSEGLTS
jgi:CheY-like chemotaxis protein